MTSPRWTLPTARYSSPVARWLPTEVGRTPPARSSTAGRPARRARRDPRSGAPSPGRARCGPRRRAGRGTARCARAAPRRGPPPRPGGGLGEQPMDAIHNQSAAMASRPAATARRRWLRPSSARPSSSSEGLRAMVVTGNCPVSLAAPSRGRISSRRPCSRRPAPCASRSALSRRRAASGWSRAVIRAREASTSARRAGGWWSRRAVASMTSMTSARSSPYSCGHSRPRRARSMSSSAKLCL